MNARLLPLALFALLPALSPTAGAAAPDAGDNGLFVLMNSDYKRPTPVPGTFFNPFKIQAVADAGAERQNTAAVSNDAVIAALTHRGISGLLYDASAKRNRAIIGDDVFTIGDEVRFSAGDEGDAPLIVGATVVLRAIETDKLTLEITPTGETARTLTFPLRAFWRP